MTDSLFFTIYSLKNQLIRMKFGRFFRAPGETYIFVMRTTQNRKLNQPR